MEFQLEADYTRDYTQSAVPEEALDYKMPVGKHKGKALREMRYWLHGKAGAGVCEDERPVS